MRGQFVGVWNWVPKCVFLSIVVFLLAPMILAEEPSPSSEEITVEFSNAQLSPSHWKIVLHPDGSGRFDAEPGPPPSEGSKVIDAGEVHRSIQLSPDFTAHAFAIAHERSLFAFPCESHMKVAFQGQKRLSYSGPEGHGSCEFNYSKDKTIQQLGDSFLAVEATIIFGARLEKLLQHDRLGLDLELENLVASAHEKTAIEIGTIREILSRIEADEQVLERARRKARLLLAQAH